MGMPELARRWTREEVLALPDDGNRYELVDGELLVTPAPRLPHQRAIRLLFQRLHSYVLAHAIGEILWSPADLDLRAEHLVQPDLFLFRSSPTGLASSWSDVGIPLLVVEIGSPTTARYDRRIKRPLYQRVGVPEYWIVDLEARIVERWRPEDHRPEVLTDALTWEPVAGVPPWEMDLGRYFGEVWGEARPA
jgi:Uma2 family endonuclease